MENEKKAAFRTWFTKKWVGWDAERGTRSTQQELADYLGIARASVAHYVRGAQIPDGENLLKIANRFGDEVYSILGLVPPAPSIPPEFKALFEEIKLSIEKAGVAPNSEAGVEIANRILDEFISRRSS